MVEKPAVSQALSSTMTPLSVVPSLPARRTSMRNAPRRRWYRWLLDVVPDGGIAQRRGEPRILVGLDAAVAGDAPCFGQEG